MTRFLRDLTTAGLMAIAINASVAMGQTASAITPPSVPPDLNVPAGNVPFLKGQATGTRNYYCLPSASGVGAWTFFGPTATLFIKFKWFNTEISQQIMTHFLSSNPHEASPNPIEQGLSRPTWQSSLDSSAVWAKALMSSTDPAYVAQGAIPWLLLQVVGAERGPTNGAMLTPTTYIHRINTSGGVKPTTSCAVGTTLLVPYTTDYIFYKSAQ